MTDAKMVQIARRIDKAHDRARLLIYDLEDSAPEFYDGLANNNSLGAYAWATHIVHHYLARPTEWETGDWGIRRVGSGKTSE